MAGIDQYTKLLLHCDGSDGSQTFTDSSGTGKVVTAVGNAQIDTAQSKFGGASALFDGTGDYLNLNGESDFAFGTGDFTIDFWFKLNALASPYEVYYDSRPSNGVYPLIYSAGSPRTLRYFVSGGDRITGTTTLTTDTWYHVAVTRSGTNTKLFLNGVQEGSTYSDSNDYLNGASKPFIGASFDGIYLNGWIDELRVSKGIARWTANFTPPTSAYSYEIGSFMIFL
jgi:hypothetical protein